MQLHSRRAFLGALPAVAAGFAGVARAQEAQSPPPVPGAEMSGEGYIPVTLPPKPGAAPSMTPEQRDAVERQLACPCPCTLDVFTCRTSMPCGFSPRMHQDVVRAVEGGHDAQAIIAAFESAYGERVLMAPKPQGFGLVGYVTPFAAVAAGGAALLVLLRTWRGRGRDASGAVPGAAGHGGFGGDATPEELSRLEAAVRAEDDR